jgi:hypothetical protein
LHFYREAAVESFWSLQARVVDTIVTGSYIDDTTKKKRSSGGSNTDGVDNGSGNGGGGNGTSGSGSNGSNTRSNGSVAVAAIESAAAKKRGNGGGNSNDVAAIESAANRVGLYLDPVRSATIAM